MSETLSTNGANGGRFKRGNPGGSGNPHAKRVARLRAAIRAGILAMVKATNTMQF